LARKERQCRHRSMSGPTAGRQRWQSARWPRRILLFVRYFVKQRNIYVVASVVELRVTRKRPYLSGRSEHYARALEPGLIRLCQRLRQPDAELILHHLFDIALLNVYVLLISTGDHTATDLRVFERHEHDRRIRVERRAERIGSQR